MSIIPHKAILKNMFSNLEDKFCVFFLKPFSRHSQVVENEDGNWNALQHWTS